MAVAVTSSELGFEVVGVHGGMKFYRGSASAARAYVEADHSRADDYYLAEGSGVATRFVVDVSDSVSPTVGKAADLDGETYELWVAGYDVDTGRAKGRLRDDANALRFVEVTVNGPKTWSLAAALHPQISAALDAAQDRAAEQIIGWVAHHATTRVGPRGRQVQVPVEQVEAAVIRHYTSRAGDPHRHLHLQINARVFAAGAWRGIHSVGMRDSLEAINGIGHAAVATDPVFRAALAEHGLTIVLVTRFRRSRDAERQQMLWLVVGVAPLPFCVVVSVVAAYASHATLAGAAVSVGISALAVGAGFSVAKYRLYDVERVVSDAGAYVMASAAVISIYAAVTVVLTRSIPVKTDSTVTTIASTLGAAGVALPAYRWARTAIDRRFNRRRFDAVRQFRTGLTGGTPDLQQLMAHAVGDPDARILFRAEDRTEETRWVTADGQPALPGSNAVDVIRRGAITAKIEFDPQRTDRSVVEAVAHEAAAEIDNLGLLAKLGRQLREVSDSRSRLAGAHLEERRRMERDLHDGAQQRLLAIALQIQSARVNGSDELLRDEADRAIVHLGLAVQELRDLAHGQQPASLTGGGLRAAVHELADRIPLRIVADMIDKRFDPQIESAAWFVIAEGVSNAVKHADVQAIHIEIKQEVDTLRVSVSDAGIGGAHSQGRGLEGLSDRVAALGGTFAVHDLEPHGTRIEAHLPCAL